MTAMLVREYIDNTRTLLGMNAARYGLIVERQVQFALLPKIQGQRAVLEPALWELLALLLDGHDGQVPALDDNAWAKASAAATRGAAFSSDGPARFPRAAAAVARALGELREIGVYPKPKLMHAG
ncbi:MAG: hypothetical protein H7Z43_01285 [Clostridia bacterium]|nr:hypothetical protein [Deltaproteobacteria bacterium]